MLYAASETAARRCIDGVLTKFPEWFPGSHKKWSYVQRDPDWSMYRAIVQQLATAPRAQPPNGQPH